MIRDRAVTPFQKKIYSLLSFGWSGRAKDWQRFEEVSLVLAGLATPLYFRFIPLYLLTLQHQLFQVGTPQFSHLILLLGLIFSGFAMVNTLLNYHAKSM